MADYVRIKTRVMGATEAWYAENPSDPVRKRARVAYGDHGSGPTYATVDVDGLVQLVGSGWGPPADRAHPEDGPDPAAADRQGLPTLLRGLAEFLNLVVYSASAAPTITDDANDGFDRGSIWLRGSPQEVYFCFDATPGAAIWGSVTGGGGGGGGGTSLALVKRTNLFLLGTRSGF